MKIVQSIKKFVLKRKYATGAAIAVIIILVIWLSKDGAPTELEVDNSTVVTTTTALQYSGTQDFSTIGTVRAFTEAAVTAETAGRVVSVNALLGQEVPAGFVIATLENASERAAVLQAEGVYEAAIASAAQSNVGVAEANTNLSTAKNTAVSTFMSSYNSVNGIVRNNIDSFFANPDAKVPGLKIDGLGNTATLNNERVAYQTILTEWQTKANTLSSSASLHSELSYAKQQVERTIAFVDSFINLFTAYNADKSYSDAELQTFTANFTNLRSSLLSVKSAIENADASLSAAEDALTRAQISASGGQSSAADAQVKQALGALRAAQANLAKTILRSPIGGTVNSLAVRSGDFVSAQAVVARVANNEALEIVSYVGEKERDSFAVGDVVYIEGDVEGTVTEIAPAVDAATGKTEMRIAIESTNIKNGDTVTVSKKIEHTESSSVVVPLSAVKFEATNGYMFAVVDGKLVARPVVLGVVRGGSVEITEGVSATDEFVIDARGLVEGMDVSVMN